MSSPIACSQSIQPLTEFKFVESLPYVNLDESLSQEIREGHAPTQSTTPISINVYSGTKDGPDGYFHNGPYPNICQYISSSQERAELAGSFLTKYSDHQTSTWSYNIIHNLGKHFGKFSVTALGNGSNSSAFLMQQEGAQTKSVLRTFSIGKLRHDRLKKAYQLNRDHVGGEWLSTTFNHPNIATNSHLVVWDSLDNSFKIMNQNEVRLLIDNRHTLEEGRQLYAVATIGDYVEGSQDLDRFIRSTPDRSEKMLRDILRNIFEGVTELHQNHVVHRDLKAANTILLPSGQAKIIDFGCAGAHTSGENLPVFGDRKVHPHESHHPVGNTPAHTNVKTDSYSLFLLTYRFATGSYFFGDKATAEEIKGKQSQLFNQETSKNFRELLEENPKLAHVSPALKDLMSQLGTSNEAQRITAEQALTHPFFADRQVEQLPAA
ncbi:protein kinase domain-containing protein [Simkania sp.]|uniref:protein kinase domain-containing protein n=1 Tax=Simkania sp. TaxID=34094 RepID=UPI003B52F8F0